MTKQTLMQLIKKRDFSTISLILSKPWEGLSCWLDDCVTLYGETALHLIMAQRPPDKLVELLILRMTESNPLIVHEDVRDSRGRTPLHNAVLVGCDVWSVRRILSSVADVMPAIAIDSYGRCPLHYSLKERPPVSPEKYDNLVRIVEVLVDAYPAATRVRDRQGKLPLDIARENGFCTRVLDLLQTETKAFDPKLSSGWESSRTILTADMTITREDSMSDGEEKRRIEHAVLDGERPSIVSAKNSTENDNPPHAIEKRNGNISCKKDEKTGYDKVVGSVNSALPSLISASDAKEGCNPAHVIEKCWFI